MKQTLLDRLLADATGESLAEVRHLGFSTTDPADVDFDSEPFSYAPQTVDWDGVEVGRQIVFPLPRRRSRRSH